MNDNDVWSSIMGVTSIDQAEKITEEMFGPLEKQEKQKKQVEPMKNLIIHNDSSFSNEELLTIIGIVTKALNEWRLFPDMKEEKEECLHQLEWLKNCRNDENVAAFFNHSGKIFLRIMPEDIRNKVICLIAFKKEAEAA